MLRTLRPFALLLILAALFVVVGCGSPDTSLPVEVGDPPVSPKGEGDHGHKAGNHNGLIIPIGRDSYHAEVVFEKEGVVRLFTLAQDEARVLEVEAQPLPAFAKAEGNTEAIAFVFKAEPQGDDGQGKTSQFAGRLPRTLWGRKVEVTIPSLRIGADRFRVGFASPAGTHPEQPAKVQEEAERQLYLTPGGKYTAADIEANGKRTASEKFQGFQPAHDLKPAPGDPICPITLTRANPACTWIVGGREYQFCCPPCVDEFVQLAKTKPEQVKRPEEYRKK